MAHWCRHEAQGPGRCGGLLLMPTFGWPLKPIQHPPDLSRLLTALPSTPCTSQTPWPCWFRRPRCPRSPWGTALRNIHEVICENTDASHASVVNSGKLAKAQHGTSSMTRPRRYGKLSKTSLHRYHNAVCASQAVHICIGEKKPEQLMSVAAADVCWPQQLTHPW